MDVLFRFVILVSFGNFNVDAFWTSLDIVILIELYVIICIPSFGFATMHLLDVFQP